MDKMGMYIYPDELIALCLTLINSEPISQSVSDVTQSVKLAHWNANRSSVMKALTHLADAGLIGVTVDDQDHWRFWSLEWTYGGGNL
jgi:hypothetical protein